MATDYTDWRSVCRSVQFSTAVFSWVGITDDVVLSLFLLIGQCLCAVVTVEGEEDSSAEGDLAVLTQQLAAFSTSDSTSRHHNDDFSVGSSPPPPSPVNFLPVATDLVPPILPHHQASLLSHSLPPSLPSSYSPCDMEEQPPSPPFHHQTPQ